MESINTACCPFCGQVKGEADTDGCVTERDYEIAAAKVCNCPGAVRERDRLERIARAKAKVKEMFGEGASEAGFDPVAETVVDRLMSDIELVSGGTIKSAVYKLPGEVTASVALSSGAIKIVRKDLNAKTAVE